MLSEKFWDRYFTVYDALNELRPYQGVLSTLAEKLQIQKDELILDAGSGTGNLSVRIEARGGIPVGVDTSHAGARIFSKKIPHRDMVIADLLSPLPFPDAYFDKIVSNNTIYTISPSERSKVGKEFFRLLKPGGMIAISDISQSFKPASIYWEHVQADMKELGFLRTLGRMARFLVPTVKIFYYNFLIKRENRSGSYAFMDEASHENFLRTAGFTGISAPERVYANQAILHTAQKPL